MKHQASSTETRQNWIYRPAFPPQWVRRPLYSMAQWVNGLAFANIQFSPTGLPVIKIAEIKSGISSHTKFTQQTFDNSVRISSGDVLFSWSGQPETSIDAYWYNGPDGWLNQHIFRVTPEIGIDRDFFFYLLRYLRPNFILIAQNKQTTGLGHVTKRDLERIEVALPNLDEQKAIGNALRSLDKKIELHRRMNETLECILQSTYKSWFLDFNSPHNSIKCLEESSTRSNKGDALAESKLGDSPPDWKLGQLSDISLSLRRSIDPQAISPSTPYIGLEHLPRRSIAIGNWGQARAVTSNKSEFRSGEILFGKICPSSGKVGLAPVSGICSTDIIVIDPKEVDYFAFVLALVSSDQFINYTDQTSTGTIMPRTSWKMMSRYPISIPPVHIAREFQAIVEPILDRINVNVHESRTLALLRDELIPKLISGSLSVDIGMRAKAGATRTEGRVEN